jgi:hypothetical protein
MHVYATLRSAATRFREKNTKKYKIYYQKKKVTKSLYFTYAWGRPYPTDCNGRMHIGLGHQRYQSCKVWWLLVKGFDFCQGSNIGFSHRKLTWPLQHCLALPRWHVIIYIMEISFCSMSQLSRSLRRQPVHHMQWKAPVLQMSAASR